MRIKFAGSPTHLLRVEGIDLGGKWTKRQVDRVLKIVNARRCPELCFFAIDITTFGEEVSWYIICQREELL